MKTKNIIKFISIIALSLSANLAIANKAEIVKNEKLIELEVEYQNVIDDFKKETAKVNPATRDEIIEFRKAIAQLNKQKRELYNALSNNAKDYLKMEQDFKKKLPLDKRKMLKVDK